MRISILVTNDSRRRWEFIYEPLKNHYKDINLIYWQKRSLCIKLLKNILIDKNNDFIFVFDGGVKSCLLSLISHFFGKHVILRLGGNPITTSKDNIITGLKTKNFVIVLKNFLYNYTSKATIKFADSIIAVSEELLKEIDTRNKNTISIPQYVKRLNIYKSEPRPNFFLNDQIKILTITNLNFFEKAKGVIWLIDSLNQWSQEKNLKIFFSVAGNGHYFERVRLKSQKHISSKLLTVNFLGFVENVDSLILENDIFLYRSFYDFIPNSILEAMALGSVVIVNNHSSFFEIIVDGLNGFIYEDKKEFFDKMNYVCSNKEKFLNFSKAAKKTIELKFSYKRVQQDLVKFLNEIQNH